MIEGGTPSIYLFINLLIYLSECIYYCIMFITIDIVEFCWDVLKYLSYFLRFCYIIQIFRRQGNLDYSSSTKPEDSHLSRCPLFVSNLFSIFSKFTQISSVAKQKNLPMECSSYLPQNVEWLIASNFTWENKLSFVSAFVLSDYSHLVAMKGMVFLKKNRNTFLTTSENVVVKHIDDSIDPP